MNTNNSNLSLLKIIYFIISFLFSLVLTAQEQSSFESEIRGLKTELNNWELQDSSRRVSSVLLRIGMNYSNEFILDSSDFYLQKSLLLSSDLELQEYSAKANIYLGLNASVRGDHFDAYKYYNNALDYYTEMEAWHDVAGILMNIGIEYKIAGDYEKGMKYCLRAIDTKLVHKDSSDLVRYYLQVSSLYNEIGDEQKRKEYLFDAKYASINSKLIDQVTVCQLYNELGDYYHFTEVTDSAQYYYTKLLEQANAIDNVYFIASANNNLGIIAMEKGNLKLAEMYHRNNEGILLNDSDLYIDNKINYAKVLFRQGKKLDANKKIQESVRFAREKGYKSIELKAVETYADFLLELNDYKEANNQLARVVEINAELHKDNLASSTANMEARFQNKFKQLEIDNLQQEKEVQNATIRNQQLMIWGSIGLILLFVVGVFYYFKNLKAESLLKETKLNYSLFRAQMNPHFMFNALHAIQLFMFKNDKNETANYLTSFAKMMRQILDYSSKEFISLEDEIELIHNYVKLQQLRLDNSFDFVVDVDEEIDIDEAQIPPMLIQPLIENAVEHGIKPLREKGKIILRITEVDELIKVEVIDNGNGLKGENIGTHESKALKLIKEQLTQLSEKESFFEIIDLSLSNNDTHGVRSVFAYPSSIAYGN